VAREDNEEVDYRLQEACNKAGVTQAAQITKMMNEFVKQVNEETSE
jgi:hypothetical protein